MKKGKLIFCTWRLGSFGNLEIVDRVHHAKQLQLCHAVPLEWRSAVGARVDGQGFYISATGGECRIGLIVLPAVRRRADQLYFPWLRSR